VCGLDGSKTGPFLTKAFNPNEELTEDKQTVTDSVFYGGRTALQATAYVPAVMTLGFLIGYFRM
jgi:hypothetical protein